MPAQGPGLRVRSTSSEVPPRRSGAEALKLYLAPSRFSTASRALGGSVA